MQLGNGKWRNWKRERGDTEGVDRGKSGWEKMEKILEGEVFQLVMLGC